MKALIIGGTNGFGKNIVEALKGKGFDTVVVGRSYSKDEGAVRYVCDVGNLDDWKRVIEEIIKSHVTFDALFFVVGYARAKSSKDLTDKDWTDHFDKNLTYVALGLHSLGRIALSSSSPIVVTIGSQWSYKLGNDELVPYTVSKHALNVLTKDFAVRNPDTRANHYCVPTMDTPQNKEVQKSFIDIEKDFPFKELADNQQVAEVLVSHCLEYRKTGKLIKIKGEQIEEIEP